VITTLSKDSIASIQDKTFCIIGAGAAGISLCIALARQGKSVALLDGGGFEESDANEDAYRGRVSTNPPECDAGEFDYSVSSLLDDSPMFESLYKLAPDLEERIERYSLPTDFGKKFRDELESHANISVLLKARCTELKPNPEGTNINSITISNGEDIFEVENKVFILSGGGIESTRLLLRAQKENATWEKFKALGRYYACHFDIIFGEMRFKSAEPKFRFQKTRDGVYARRKLQFSSTFQEKYSLLNSTFRLHFPAYSDPSHRSGVLSLIYLAKSILPGEHQAILDHGKTSVNKPAIGPHIRNVICNCGSIVSFAFTWLFKIKLAKRKLPYTLETNSRGTYPLELNSEQIPHPDNAITLSDEKDAFGMPRINLHWELKKEDIDSAVRSFEALQTMLNELEDCELSYDKAQLIEEIQKAPPIGGHHLGTTRMGRDIKDSVVDTNCRVHDVDNLFIASSSIFTTSGHANPTLLIVAFALRLADYLSKK